MIYDLTLTMTLSSKSTSIDFRKESYELTLFVTLQGVSSCITLC